MCDPAEWIKSLDVMRYMKAFAMGREMNNYKRRGEDLMRPDF